MNFLFGAEISCPLSVLQRVRIIEVILTKNVWVFSRDQVDCPYQRGVRKERFDCTPVWYFDHIKSTRLIVQRLHSARRCASARTAGIENRTGAVTRLIQELNWEPLRMRRGRARLMLFFKIIRGVLAIPVPSNTCQATTLQQNPSVPSPEIHCCELWHLGEREFLSQYDKLVEQPNC